MLCRGQLLPKKPELLNVFKHRREEEKKREEERCREQTKLEQILARQRQKLEEVHSLVFFTRKPLLSVRFSLDE